MGDQGPGQNDVVALYEDDSSKLYLHYFFNLVFGYQIKFLQRSVISDSVCRPRWLPRLFVVAPNRFGDDLITLIQQVAEMENGPFILAMKAESDPMPNETLFEAGSHEVLAQPLSLKELAFRLKSRSSDIGLSFNFETHQLRTLDIAADVIQRADLTDIEAQVILVLMEKGGQIVTRDALSLAIDKKPWNYGNRKFDVHVARIRKKLDSAYGGDLTLRTIRSAGYQLTVGQDL